MKIMARKIEPIGPMILSLIMPRVSLNAGLLAAMRLAKTPTNAPTTRLIKIQKWRGFLPLPELIPWQYVLRWAKRANVSA